MSAVKIHCALGLNVFFSFRYLLSQVRPSKLQKLYPSAIDKCAIFFVPPLTVEKWRIEAFVNTIAQFTNFCRIHLAGHWQYLWPQCDDPRKVFLVPRDNLILVHPYTVNYRTMERLDQGHLHPPLEHPRSTCPGRGLNPRPPGPQASTQAKSYLFEQLINCHSQPRHSLLLLPVRNL